MNPVEDMHRTDISPGSGLVRVRLLADARVRPGGYGRLHPAGSGLLVPLNIAADLVRDGVAEFAGGVSIVTKETDECR